MDHVGRPTQSEYSQSGAIIPPPGAVVIAPPVPFTVAVTLPIGTVLAPTCEACIRTVAEAGRVPHTIVSVIDHQSSLSSSRP